MRLRAVVNAGGCGFKRFVVLVQWLEIVAFTGYLGLVNYQMHQRLNNKLTIFTFCIIIKVLETNSPTSL